MNKKIITVICSVCLCFAIALTVFAAQAGSSEDPLVSKSYVDDKINQILNSINNNSSNTTVNTGLSDTDIQKMKTEILEELTALLGDNLSSDLNNSDTANTTNTSNSSSSSGSYVPVYANVGQIVIGGEGTEIILRSGKANAYITGAAGIVNATTGKELVNGNKAEKNNIMIIPRADGRGFKVTEAAWFLIKGDYEIK